MAAQQKRFECYIVDKRAEEHFRAAVLVVKKSPIAASAIDTRRIELAHVYITALADRWKGATATFSQDSSARITKSESDSSYAVKDGRSKDHSHFVLFDASGSGKYIRRNRFGTDEEVRFCSMWDLGPEFGNKLAETLAEFM